MNQTDLSEAWPDMIRAAGLLSVVIPAYNEERRLPRAIREITAYLNARSITHEILIVDDGSIDQTASCIAELANTHPTVLGLRLSKNAGKGAAVRAGMLHARGDWVLFTDADQATSIDQLPEVIVPLLRGFDVAMGSRALGQSAILSAQRWYRQILARVFAVFTRSLLVYGFRDCQCGFKSFRRSAAQAIFSEVSSNTAIFDMEVMLIAARKGLRVAEVPIVWSHDPDSRLQYTAVTGIGLLVELMRIRRHWGLWVPKRVNVTQLGTLLRSNGHEQPFGAKRHE